MSVRVIDFGANVRVALDGTTATREFVVTGVPGPRVPRRGEPLPCLRRLRVAGRGVDRLRSRPGCIFVVVFYAETK